MPTETATAEPTTKAAPVKQTLGDLATAIRGNVESTADYDVAKAYVSSIADYLASNNKRFDRNLFFAACGVNPRG